MNGSNALPACPNPAIHPIEPVSSHRGSTRRAWFIARGYIGPSSMPTRETATASPTREGTNQMTSSSLVVAWLVRGRSMDEKRQGDVRNCEERIDEDDTAFAHLIQMNVS